MNLNYSFVTSEEFMPLFRENRPKLFGENNDVNYALYWSDEEHEKFKALQKKCSTDIRFYLLCKDGDKVAGWSWGTQLDAEEFYMVNSAVFPEYRNRGVYKTMMNMMIAKAKDEGFQIISSKHRATNNAVLVPKLKAGFKLIAMKLHPRFGVLVELHYYTNEKMNGLLDYRTGESKDFPKA